MAVLSDGGEASGVIYRSDGIIVTNYSSPEPGVSTSSSLTATDYPLPCGAALSRSARPLTSGAWHTYRLHIGSREYLRSVR